jgi:hypothetical protein
MQEVYSFLKFFLDMSIEAAALSHRPAKNTLLLRFAICLTTTVLVFTLPEKA